MLVLSRRVREAVLFPTLGITVRIIHLKGGTVRLGIEAPPEVTVLREELLPLPIPVEVLSTLAV